MAARSETYRARSPRSRARREERNRETDAVTVALVAQIILCVLLLFALNMTKGSGPERFSQIKEEYRDLVGSDAAGSLTAYLDGIGELGRGFFSSAENLLRKFFGKEMPAAAAPPSAETEAEAEVSLDFGYGYLEAQGASQGSVPTQLAGAAAGIPADCTISPVASSARFRSPVTGVITSEFAYREHPVSGNSDFHNGIDIAAEEGRSILAALPGEVVEVGEDDIYGKYIILQHATNLKTFYAHCSGIIAKEGMAVARGERIAKVGMTGVATGNHLHFSVIVDGMFTDPFWVLRDNIVLVEE